MGLLNALVAVVGAGVVLCILCGTSHIVGNDGLCSGCRARRRRKRR